MPSWVWPQVCQRKEHKERSCQDVIIPPHPTPPPRIWRRCHVECGRKCVRGRNIRNAAARMLLSHPAPPHPTPPPPASGDDAMLTVAAIVTRMLVSESYGWWLGNCLFLVAKSSCFGCGIAFFGCGIVFFWLRNRFFFGCGSAFFWLRKRVWFWLRNRRNLVAEASKYGFGIGLYSNC